MVVVRHRLRPKGGSGGEFEFRNGHIWTVQDGAIVSLVRFPVRPAPSKPWGCGSRRCRRERRVADDLLDAAAQLGARHWPKASSPRGSEIPQRWYGWCERPSSLFEVDGIFSGEPGATAAAAGPPSCADSAVVPT